MRNFAPMSRNEKRNSVRMGPLLISAPYISRTVRRIRFVYFLSTGDCGFSDKAHGATNSNDDEHRN